MLQACQVFFIYSIFFEVNMKGTARTDAECCSQPLFIRTGTYIYFKPGAEETAQR